MKKNITSDATVATLKFVATNAGMRKSVQEGKGVALNAAATYCNRYVESGSVDRTIEAVAGKKLTWKDEESALFISGNKGTTARYGRESKCGKFFEAIGTSGAKAVIGLDIFGDGSKGGSVKVVSIQGLAKWVAKNQAVTFSRNSDKQVFTGRILAKSLDSAVVGLAYGTTDGRLLVVDIETDKSNIYNHAMRGHISTQDATALGLSDTVIAAVAGGAVTRAGKKRTRAVKAKKG